MSSRLQRLLAPPSDREVTGIQERTRQPGVLAVTADIRFYSQVLNAACTSNWRTEWARTLNRAIEICGSGSMPIVVYDANLPDTEWREAFDRLSGIPNHPRLLLATNRIDEDLWTKVLRHHGYDLVERSAGAEELTRLFRFAWLSVQAPAMA